MTDGGSPSRKYQSNPMLARLSLQLKRLVRDEAGPTAAEYAVIISLIVAVCVGAFRQVSTAAADTFDASAAALDTAFNGN